MLRPSVVSQAYNLNTQKNVEAGGLNSRPCRQNNIKKKKKTCKNLDKLRHFANFQEIILILIEY